MRVTTAFNKMLSIPGANVAAVEFAPDGGRGRAAPPGPSAAVSVWLGDAGRSTTGRRVAGGIWTWARRKLLLRGRDPARWTAGAAVGSAPRRCPGPGPRARFTRDFEDVVAWLAQRSDKTTITRLLRCSWEAVAGIVTRVVAEQLDDARLSGLLPDRGRRGLLPQGTPVPDRGRRPRPGRRGGLGRRRQDRRHPRAVLRRARRAGRAALQAVSMDLRRAKKATDASAPQARQCVDPFHLVELANDAIDKARRWPSGTSPARPPASAAASPGRPRPAATPAAQLVKHTRWALLKDPDALDRHPTRRARTNCAAARPCSSAAGQLKEGLRDLYRLPTGPPRPTPTSTGGWPGPAAPASPPSSPCPRPSAANRDRDPRRRRPRPVQQQARRPQQQDPAHQPPRLRPPQRRRRHRHDLPLLRRTHHHTAHRKVRRTRNSAVADTDLPAGSGDQRNTSAKACDGVLKPRVSTFTA